MPILYSGRKDSYNYSTVVMRLGKRSFYYASGSLEILYARLIDGCRSIVGCLSKLFEAGVGRILKLSQWKKPSCPLPDFDVSFENIDLPVLVEASILDWCAIFFLTQGFEKEFFDL